jgi:hypothetical protein
MYAVIEDQLTGIVGYVPAQRVKALESGNLPETIDFQFEPHNDLVTMRVNSADIVELRKGSDEGGSVRYHVLLKDDAQVETAVKAFRNVNAIEDATLSRLTAAANVSVSFV